MVELMEVCMKNKKIMIISLIVAISIFLGGIGFYILNKPNKDTTLSIVENSWIESNKNKLIDLSVINQVPILNYEGKGLIFEFLESLEKDTGLEFNKVPISSTDAIKTEYAITVTDNLEKEDLLLYEDNYAVITKDNIKYNRLSDMKEITLGVLKEDLEKVNSYLQGSAITLKTFETASEMINALKVNNESEGTINAIVLPKTAYLEEIIKNEFVVAYNITEYKIYYVFRLGKTKRLNTILNKYYKKWYQENYQDTYHNYLASAYFNFHNIDDKTRTKFKSKRYVYGFVANPPYDIMIGTKLRGYNSSFLKLFSNLADVEVSFQEYHKISDMIKDFNENKIDIMLDNYEEAKYNLDVVNTVSPYDEQLLILSHNGSSNLVNSVVSLENQKVLAVKNSIISFYLKANKVKVEEYDSLERLMEKLTKNSIVAIDSENYKYYKNTSLKNFKIDYQELIAEDYQFVIRDIKDNEIFADLFNFSLAFAKEKNILNDSLYELSKVEKNPIETGNIILLIMAIVLFVTALLVYIKLMKAKKKKNKISKEDKLRYIDSLTSLKNRAYLNDNIETWDQSEIYPQAIIIVDLNNIAYINDNYGHQEGDQVIKEAANILIRGQIENSDIVRTNGNEFLIYLVGYDEKQVVAYNRKLNKELKELSHGFGATSGYSMIMDAIKTIDDAVNEATLDMRNNKEELNN